MTTQPRFALKDIVIVHGNGSRSARWKIEAIELPTRSKPQYGYRLRQAGGSKTHTRTADEDKLTLIRNEAEVKT